MLGQDLILRTSLRRDAQCPELRGLNNSQLSIGYLLSIYTSAYDFQIAECLVIGEN